MKPQFCMLLALVLALTTSLCLAQAPTGIILGTVTDASGAVVPNATITITNKATQVPRSASTNAEGLFSAPALPSGQYEVRVEVQGFRTVIREAQVEAGSSTTVNLSLSPGTS